MAGRPAQAGIRGRGPSHMIAFRAPTAIHDPRVRQGHTRATRLSKAVNEKGTYQESSEAIAEWFKPSGLVSGIFTFTLFVH